MCLHIFCERNRCLKETFFRGTKQTRATHRNGTTRIFMAIFFKRLKTYHTVIGLALRHFAPDVLLKSRFRGARTIIFPHDCVLCARSTFITFSVLINSKAKIFIQSSHLSPKPAESVFRHCIYHKKKCDRCVNAAL